MNVLVVDDNRLSLDTYRAAIKRLGPHDVYAFHDATEAMGWATYHETDLLLLDYRMPDIDGLQFVVAFRQLPGNADVPIMMLTAEREREVRHQALQMGVSDFLNKPADPVEFLSRVKNLLALRESRKKLENYAASLAADVARATKEIADREEETINRLTRAAEFRDSETGLHIVRMGKYAEVLGRTLELDAEDQRLLRLATPMHDIGKVATPDGILLKEGPLNPEEWEIMKRHARSGYDILVGSSSKVLQLAAQIALRHHERWDGTGYPDRLRGTQIPLAARIAAVGDVFDALCSKRPYKRAWTVDEALRVIQKSSGSHFDPMVIDALNASWSQFLDIQKEYADTGHAA